MASTPTCKAALKEAVWQLAFLFHQVCFLELLLFFIIIIIKPAIIKPAIPEAVREKEVAAWEEVFIERHSLWDVEGEGKQSRGMVRRFDPCSDAQSITVLHQQ